MCVPHYEWNDYTSSSFVSTKGRMTMQTQRVTLPLYDLSCGGGGVLTIERALVRTLGVVSAYANPATEMAYVEYDPQQVTPERLVKAIEWAGFRAGMPNIR